MIVVTAVCSVLNLLVVGRPQAIEGGGKFARLLRKIREAESYTFYMGISNLKSSSREREKRFEIADRTPRRLSERMMRRQPSSEISFAPYTIREVVIKLKKGSE